MSKKLLQIFKAPLIFFIFVFVLFFALVFSLNEKASMIVDISTYDDTRLAPQIFFSKGGHHFSEKNSSNPKIINKNQYYFTIPNIEHIDKIRIDPHNNIINDISIHKIIVIQQKWFHTSIFSLDEKNLKPIHHVNGFDILEGSVKFDSIGRDSQLHIDFLLTETLKKKLYHPDLFLLSIITVLLFFYLSYIFRTQKINNLLTSKLILYALFFAFALFKVNFYKENINFGQPPDEIAHFSYIDYLTKNDKFIPKFEDMRTFNNATVKNHLVHPPVYYYLMSLTYNSNFPLEIKKDNLRFFSMLIFISSFLLLLYLGFSSKLSLLSHLVYLTVISSLPMYAYIGASISNDTLAILGGVIFAIGLRRILDNNNKNLDYYILILGALIAYFSKLSAAILIFFIVIYLFIYILKSKKSFKVSRTQIILLILSTLPIISYQIYIYIEYLHILPKFAANTAQFVIPEENRLNLNYSQWFERLQYYVDAGWFGIHSHHSYTKESIFDYIGLLILHIFAIVSLFLKSDKKNMSYYILGKLSLLALISTYLIQFLYSYQVHLNTGYLGGLQPRYLLPFVFSFAILASLFTERFKKFFLFQLGIILICIHAIYSDFFYFLRLFINSYQ